MDGDNYVVKYDMASSIKNDELHIHCWATYDGNRYEIAHWVASHKDQMVREYLLACGWKPPETTPTTEELRLMKDLESIWGSLQQKRRKPATHTDTCMCNDCTPETKPEVAK